MSVLAIDLGTGGPKVAVVADDGTVLGSGVHPVATRFLPDGGAEQDAEEWWSATLIAAREALAQAGPRAGRVAAICCDSQYFTNVAVDREGRPLAPAMTWMDTRSGGHASALLDAEWFGRWIDIHGLVPFGPGLGHILYMKQEHPDVYAAAAAFVEPMDFLNLRLTGRIAATASTAMPMLLTDNRTLGQCEYSDVLLGRAGIDRDKLPPLVPMDAVLGPVLPAVADELGIDRGALVVAGASDSITAAVGAGAFGPGEGAVIVGTTTVLACHHPSRLNDLSRMVVTVPSVFADRWFVMAENGIGGKALDWFLRGVVFAEDELAAGPVPDDVFLRADAAAVSVDPGANGVLFLPWLTGALAPRPDTRLHGGFLNVGLTTSRAELTRAVMEGVALNLAWMRDELEPMLGQSFPRLRFAGGGALSPTWGQIMADVLGVPVEAVEAPRHVNARGAAFLALQRLGQLRFEDIPQLLRAERVYEPRAAAAARYRVMGEVLVELHGALADPMSRLSGMGMVAG